MLLFLCFWLKCHLCLSSHHLWPKTSLSVDAWAPLAAWILLEPCSPVSVEFISKSDHGLGVNTAKSLCPTVNTQSKSKAPLVVYFAWKVAILNYGWFPSRGYLAVLREFLVIRTGRMSLLSKGEGPGMLLNTLQSAPNSPWKKYLAQHVTSAETEKTCCGGMQTECSALLWAKAVKFYFYKSKIPNLWLSEPAEASL